MDLINQRVLHKTYGTGIIVTQIKEYIEVNFDAICEIKKFPYPSCFEKFLKLEDDSLQSAIESKLSGHYLKMEEQLRQEKEEHLAMRQERDKIFSNTVRPAKQNENRRPVSSDHNSIKQLSAAASSATPAENNSAGAERLSATAAEYDRIFRMWSTSNHQSELVRQRFVSDYPIDRISDLFLDEYLIAKEGHGHDRSFCRRLRYDLQVLSSMGNIRFNTFGVYYDPNDNIALSVTYQSMFGNDINSAFKYIKKEIVTLLKAAEREDYQTIHSIRLNSSFKYKLITVYYPDLYVPVVTNNILDEYCRHVGLSVNPNEPMIYRNVELRNWKNRNPELSDWPNSKLMGFCDWLWRSNRYYKSVSS